MYFENFFCHLDDIKYCIHRSSNVFETLFKSSTVCYSVFYTDMAANFDLFNARFLVLVKRKYLN